LNTEIEVLENNSENIKLKEVINNQRNDLRDSFKCINQLEKENENLKNEIKISCEKVSNLPNKNNQTIHSKKLEESVKMLKDQLGEHKTGYIELNVKYKELNLFNETLKASFDRLETENKSLKESQRIKLNNEFGQNNNENISPQKTAKDKNK